MRTILLALTVSLAAGCAALSAGGSGTRIVDTRTGTAVPLEQVADELAGADVVFLGELHDSPDCHRLQLELTQLLLERRGEIIVSLEQFERDDQWVLDRYLAGEIGEAQFLEEARSTWPNYADDYRPVVELARKNGMRVLAANVPRPLASRVVREGINTVLGEEFAPRQVYVAAGPYKDAFREVMGEHGDRLGGAEFDNIFAAQCIKDDAMAESIADSLLPLSERPLVIHWCGAFHSDRGLGTVERLKRRMSALDLVVLSTVRPEDLDRPLTEDELASGRYVFVVRR